MTPGCIEADVEALAATAARFRWAVVCRADVEAQRLLEVIAGTVNGLRADLAVGCNRG